MESFFYKAGKFETTKPWNRPNIQSISSFFKDIIGKTDILNRYDVIIYGGCLYKNLSNTWDLDINISSKYLPNHIDLENDFLVIQKIGEDNNLLIDLNWTSIPFSKIFGMGITKENVYDILENVNEDYIKIGFFEKKVNNTMVMLRDIRNEENRFGEYLVRYKLKDILAKASNHPTWIKWDLLMSVPVKYINANQVMSGDYLALIDESNKII